MKVEDIFRYLLILSFVTLLIVFWRQFTNSEPIERLKTQDKTTKKFPKPLKQCNEGSFFSQMDNACIRCDKGSFSFKGWIGCLPWLDCKSIERDVRTRRLLSKPSQINTVKYIFLADWHGYEVVYMKCAHEMFWDDCRNNARMLKGLQGSELVVQLIGTCEGKQEIITTFYHHGSADKLNQLMTHLNFGPKEELEIRIQLAKDYVRILNFLHNSPLGVRVMCDTNDLTKTVSQFLITDGLRLVVNDLDALPEVDQKSGKLLIKCGHRELFGWFVAPEQLWPFDDEPFNDAKMPGYDEKIDIWRIPAVVIWFLGDTVDSLRIKARLGILFNKCKANNPKSRPTAHEVLKFLETIKL